MVKVAQHAGFCFGVKRAVAIAEANTPCVTLGEITHNRLVIDSLREKGIIPVEDPRNIPEGSKCVIRSHGVSKAVLESLQKRDIRLIDATCPYVRKIHRIAEQAAAEGRKIFVAGRKDHPEVMGILGWAEGNGIALLDAKEAALLPECKRPILVSQTTLSEREFQNIKNAILARFPDTEVFETRCPSTRERQEESLALARESDIMLVVGSSHSANTKELYNLCKAVCEKTYLVETADDTRDIPYAQGDRIALTTGASTPDCTFEEVVSKMNDIEKKDQLGTATPAQEPQESMETITDADFMADVEKSLVQLRPGQTVTGTVLTINDEEVCVNVGYKADGLIKIADLSSTDVKVGDEIEVEVVKVNDGEGNVLLSQRNLINKKNWDEIIAKYEANEFVDGTGKEAVKGGLIATVLGIRTFIPASQLATHYVEKIQEFVGQEMKLKIIEIDKTKKRIVASRKEVLRAEEAERKKNAWASLEVGTIVRGTVRRITDFGVFVDIGGVDGLVHVTDLAWYHVKHPSEVVSVKQQIDVKIQSLDPEKQRISLSYKATQPKPWDVAEEKYPVDSIVEGKVVRITTFGAFVELEPGLDGLVHISQCAPTRIEKVEDAVAVGDVVRVKVLGVNTADRRISLSIRGAKEDEAFDGINEEVDNLGEEIPTTEEQA